MIEKYLLIDDVLDEPESIRKFALEQRFYNNIDHPRQPKNWVGLRSLPLHELDEDIFQTIFHIIFRKCLNNTFGEKSDYVFLNYNVNSYFHLLPEECKFTPEWIHKDVECLYAGVLYLNPAGEHFGTKLFLDGKEIEVNNKFNRLMIYNSNVLHAPINGSGEGLDSSRLALVFFINQLNLQFKPR